MKTNRPLLGFLAAAILLLVGCDYDAPLTSAPTHKIDPRLLGEWAPAKPGDEKDPPMYVRQWDESNYAVLLEKDVYRAWHSDFAGATFVSVQDLSSDARKYCYFKWSLSADGRQLTLQRVRTEVVPEKTTPASAIRKAIKSNLDHPQLLAEPLVFSRRPEK